MRSEDGLALPLVLMVLLVFTVTSVTAVTMTTSAQSTTATSTAQQQARELAEGGVNAAEALLNGSDVNAISPTLLGCSTSPEDVHDSAPPCTDLTISTASGTVAFHGLYTQGTGDTGTWTILASGAVGPAVAGAASVVRTTTATASVVGGGQVDDIPVWNYVYATAPLGSGCGLEFDGNNVVVDVPLYVTGNLCLSGNNAKIAENTATGGQPMDVRVGGKVVLDGNNATVGTSSSPITSGYSALGCASSLAGTPHTCTTADHWYVKTTDAPLTATPPVTDYPGAYASASPGPDHPCDPALTPAPDLATTDPTAFDDDTAMNGANTQFDLTPATSYNCVTSTGELSWNASTHLLTVSGTIFFDGDVTATDTQAMYHGQATLYVNGEFSMDGNNPQLLAGCPASPAAPTSQCSFSSGAWNPNKDLLLIVTDAAGGDSVVLSGNNVQLQAALFCPSDSVVDLSGNNVQLEGPMICGSFSHWGNNVKMYPLPAIGSLPWGAPVPPNTPATVAPPLYER